MHALLIFPPFTRSSSTPPLGLAMLRGAAERRGHDVTVVDLAADEVRLRCSTTKLRRPTGVWGDHDKHPDVLHAAQTAFFKELRCSQASASDCRLSFSELDSAVADASHAPWVRHVVERLLGLPRPAVVGVSVMFGEQVLPSLVVAHLAKQIWPSVDVIFGGAHITALAPEISQNLRYGAEVDGFLAGYAEDSFADLLDAIAFGWQWPQEVFRAGGGRWDRARGEVGVVPSFGELEAYTLPRLTLPAQVTRGCAYAKCAYCTYPFVEDSYHWDGSLGHAPMVVELAKRLGAVVSFKDALLLPPVLEALAEMIDGRVAWSACTKLSNRLDATLLHRLAESGCKTLEVGLETVLPRSQLLIAKRQPLHLLESTLAATSAAGITLVVNYMTGFPGEHAASAADALKKTRTLVESAGGVLSHNALELQRRAPLARTLPATAPWPWSAELVWGASAVAA